MQVDILYMDDTLQNIYSLMDIAYIYDWKRVSNLTAVVSSTFFIGTISLEPFATQPRASDLVPRSK